MEGGTVDRLKNVTAAAPSPADVFASGDKKMFRAHGRLIGEGVRALGFNTDFAPVFDLALPPSRNVLRSRTVSPDPNQVVLYAREFLAGLRESGVLGCGKHFPGLGEASLDSHHELPVVHKSWQRLWDEDLYPYRALRRQIPFLMVAHAAFPGVTGNGTPASLSRKWITEILRKEIGYRGLVISDDLDMAGVLAAGSIEHAAVETIRAGADIFLVCRNEEHLWRSYKAVLQEAERDQVFARQVKRAARRLLAFKKSARKRLQLPVPPTAAVTQELRERLENFTETLKLIPQPAAARPTTAAQ
jgi:beta-N-acetylhexosaminidase